MKRVLLVSLAFTFSILSMEQAPSYEEGFPTELKGNLTPLLYHGITKKARCNPNFAAAINVPQNMLGVLNWASAETRYLAHVVDLAQRLQQNNRMLPVMQEPCITNWLSSRAGLLQNGMKLFESVRSYTQPDPTPSLLNSRTIDLNYKDGRYRETPLLNIGDYGSENQMTFLLAAGCSTEVRDNYGRTPLSVALQAEKISKIKLLLDYGAIPLPSHQNPEIQQLLTQAAKKYKSADLQGKFSTLESTTSATQWGNAEPHLPAILAEGITTTAATNTSFHSIINRSKVMLATLQWFLTRAQYTAHVVQIMDLFEQKDFLPIMKDPRIVAFKAQTMARLHGGKELFHAAAFNIISDAQSLLKDKDIALNWQERLGRTPLLEAVARKHYPIIKQLLESGAKTNTADMAGSTPLEVAAYNGDNKTTKELLDAGALLDSQNDEGRTALMQAVASNHLKIAHLLITADALFDLQDKFGLNARAIARAQDNPNAVDALDIMKEINEANNALLQAQQQLASVNSQSAQQSSPLVNTLFRITQCLEAQQAIPHRIFNATLARTLLEITKHAKDNSATLHQTLTEAFKYHEDQHATSNHTAHSTISGILLAAVKRLEREPCYLNFPDITQTLQEAMEALEKQKIISRKILESVMARVMPHAPEKIV
jgi:ankyrin repeat protein